MEQEELTSGWADRQRGAPVSGWSQVRTGILSACEFSKIEI